MTDDFIRQLQADWVAQPVDRALVVRRLTRGRWTPRVLLALEIFQGVFGLVTGVVVLWLAFDPDRLVLLFGGFDGLPAEAAAAKLRTMQAVFATGGGVTLIAVPPLAWAAVQARLGSLKWEDETPESVLRFGLRRADASLRANRVGRWHAWALLAFSAGLWLLPAFGLAPVVLVAVQTVIYVVVIGVLWLWLDLRRERLRRELETCLKLLEEYQAEP